MQSEGSLQKRLVDVGVEIVLTEGVSSVGLREIARRAGVSHGAPRRYFPTHQALLSAIARRGFADLAERFAKAAGDAPSPVAQLRALAGAYVRYAQERPGMFELMFRHDLLRGQALAAGQPQLREASMPLFGRIVDLISRSRKRESGPGDVPAEVTAVALWTNVHGLAQLWGWGSVGLALGDDSAQADDRLDELVTAIIDAHLGGADT
ncbi:TetR/AcrR family transcriptional regulator [Microtetraspora malaysiensis]|uniref:TetR/AcrR family transcriptional regulator n=1 Tax=Microtetraspora malaysiensis TaxID=161358 RepID=UPI00082F5F15|nr:TetR/AcrR family transcriptional regulator [Microtetraspora malaysiensis]